MRPNRRPNFIIVVSDSPASLRDLAHKEWDATISGLMPCSARLRLSMAFLRPLLVFNAVI